MPFPSSSREIKADCLSCRIIGTVVFLGAGVYLGSALWKRPPPVGLHRYVLVLASASCAGMGIYRAVA